MPTIVTTRYTATLNRLGTCEVSGPDALLLVQRPDNTADLEAQRLLRQQIQDQFYAMETGPLNCYPENVVMHWSAC